MNLFLITGCDDWPALSIHAAVSLGSSQIGKSLLMPLAIGWTSRTSESLLPLVTHATDYQVRGPSACDNEYIYHERLERFEFSGMSFELREMRMEIATGFGIRSSTFVGKFP
jgi:hypothetical protein